ncbi:unnamed protein product [Discula destructiva]
MSKVTYHIENAPGKIYGKNSNELIFKEPASNAHIYTTATDTGLLRATKKHLFRGPPSEKDGGVCIATIDEPSHSTLEMHHHHSDPTGDAAPRTTTTKLKLVKKSSWVPLSGSSGHSLTFRDSTYTWSSNKSTLTRDRDSAVVARVTGGWFFQGKLADIEVDVPEDVVGGDGDGDDIKEEARRDTLEMVLASFVQRWWGDKVEEETRAREKKEAAREQKEVQKAVAREKKGAKEEEEKKKKRQQKEEEEKKAAEAQANGTVMGP